MCGVMARRTKAEFRSVWEAGLAEDRLAREARSALSKNTPFAERTRNQKLALVLIGVILVLLALAVMSWGAAGLLDRF